MPKTVELDVLVLISKLIKKEENKRTTSDSSKNE